MIKSTLLMLAWQPFQCPKRLVNMPFTVQRNMYSQLVVILVDLFIIYFLPSFALVGSCGNKRTLIERYDIGFVWQTISDENSSVQGKTFLLLYLCLEYRRNRYLAAGYFVCNFTCKYLIQS